MPLLPSSRRYSEAWAALDKAKRLHFLPHAANYTEKDYGGGLDRLRRLFPPAVEGQRAAAQAGADGGVQHGAAAAGTPQDDPPPAALPADVEAAPPVHGAAGGSAAWLQRQLRKLTKAGGVGAGPLAADGSGSGGDMRAIFVTGLPRSGSTLIEQILARWAPCLVPAAGAVSLSLWHSC